MTLFILYRTAEHGRQANRAQVFLCDAIDANDAFTQATAAAKAGARYAPDSYAAVPLTTFLNGRGRFLWGDATFPGL